MSRKWTEIISPKYMHDTLGVYQVTWMPQMDRCWVSDDGFQVMSRLLNTEWGKGRARNNNEVVLRNGKPYTCDKRNRRCSLECEARNQE